VTSRSRFAPQKRVWGTAQIRVGGAEEQGTPKEGAPMTRKPDGVGATNVIELARVRSAPSRRAVPRWPNDGPGPDRVAVAALQAACGEAALVTADGTVLAVNEAWIEATPACGPGTNVYTAWGLHEVDPTDAATLVSGIRAAAQGTDGFVHAFDRADGACRFSATSLGGAVGGAVLAVVSPPADRDAIAGLASRVGLVDHLATLLGSSEGTAVGVLVVNFHDFKLVNQAYGHAAGDQLLVEVACRLMETVGDDDVVAHLGGDEFAVLTCAGDDPGHTAQLAAAVAGCLARPFTVGNRVVHLVASIGCRVTEPVTDTDPTQVLRDAVAAMRDARRSRAATIAFFSEATRSRVARRLSIEEDLRDAVEHGRLTLAFQPQVDMRTGEVHGAEALVRWRHEEFGNVPPTEFVTIAEETGLITALGEWVLDEACRELARWKRTATDVPRFVTVNLSPLQLTDDSIVGLVASALREHGLAPEELCVELTEGALMSSPEKGIDALRSLRDMGASIALDDFGTGYSSLGMLKALPVDVLKLDRAFVVGLAASDQDRAIVAAIMSLAEALGLATVAEGVEETDQAQGLLRLGCTVVQGWLYAPAVPGDEYLQLCHDGFAPLTTPQIGPAPVEQ
jgi:diguanylate cyclase (GGDEF)-like protein